MRLSEKNKIVLPVLLIAVIVFSTFGWIYRFQNYEMKRIIESERLLDQVREGMLEINRTIQSGILTLDERYAVQAAQHSLRVFERLSALEKLQPADAEAVRRRYLDYYVKIVSINSLFLENRLDEGLTRLAELEINSSKINAEMDGMIQLRIGQYREEVRNINLFMAATSVIFATVLILIAGLFMHYSRKRKEAEKALVEAEKMVSLGTLAAGVAHEIKNPLAIILLGIEDLNESLTEDSSVRYIIQGIKEAVLRADRIVKGLLSFCSRPASGQEKLDVITLVQDTLTSLNNNRQLQNIRIETEFSPDLPKPRGDSGQIRQAFLNILTNAVESMPGGGILKVLCKKKGPDSVDITFTDTGSGISEDNAGRVLDPFYTTKQKSGNIGLGLSIAKGIIEAHGGSLTIKSAQGKGTAVTISLPGSG